MPSPAQSGAVAREIAEQFGTTGRTPLSVDEIVVPVKIAMPYDELVWAGASSGAGWASIRFLPNPGEFANIYLHNPAGSGVLAQVDFFEVFNNSTTTPSDVFFRLRPGVPAGATDAFNGLSRPTDTRRSTLEVVAGPRTVVQFKELSTAAAGSPAGEAEHRIVDVNATRPYRIENPRIFLKPDWALEVYTTDNDHALFCNARWRERPLRRNEPTE